MAQVAARKRTCETRETLNDSFFSGQNIIWKVSGKSYSGKVLGKWSNFGLVILLDGYKDSTIINLMVNKIEVPSHL